MSWKYLRISRRPACIPKFLSLKNIPFFSLSFFSEASPYGGSVRACHFAPKSLAEFAPCTAQIKSESFSPAACTSGKILLALQVWNFCAFSAEIMRAAGCNSLQTRAQRSGSRLRACQKYFFDTLRACSIWSRPFLRAFRLSSGRKHGKITEKRTI